MKQSHSDKSSEEGKKNDREVPAASEQNVLFCVCLVPLAQIFAGDSQTVYSTLKLLSSDRANIYCAGVPSMGLGLGCLFLKLVSFGFGLASESWLYYWPEYPYGADKNVWVGYKFQALPTSLAALFYVLFMVIHFPARQGRRLLLCGEWKSLVA